MRVYDKENKRLVYIEERATPDFWDREWDVTNFKQTVERNKNSRSYLRILHKYIPDKRGRILEGGCGLGWLVYYMHSHGYTCIGIDFAEKTIRRIKEMCPELDVRIGDVRNLPFPDNYFRGYWSLGVIEHFWDGYHDILGEMRRVLVEHGYVFVSFPYMSFLRKLKAKFALYDEFNSELVDIQNFFQFALDAKTVIKDFETAGFRLVTSKPGAGIWGFKEELSLFKPMLLWYWNYMGRNLLIKGSRLLLNKILASFAGHAISLVFQKE